MHKMSLLRQSTDRNLSAGLSISQTSCINGIFVMLIFLSHFCSYIDTSTMPYFEGYLRVRTFLGQMVVAPFLFFSGYGVMEQIQKKKTNYINTMPRKRIFKTWLHFALAVILYFGVSVYLQKRYALKTIILAFTGWTSLGNSNWYMFAILLMYLNIYISCKYFKGNKVLVSCFILSICYLLAVRFFQNGSWWYNTIMCFPAGVFISWYKDDICRFLDHKYFIAFIICIIVMLTASHFRNYLIAYEIMSIFLCFAIILFCSFIKMENSLFAFLGKYSFEIYILQRIPMILFQKFFSGYTYMSVCLLATVILAILFKKLEKTADKMLNI